MAMYDRYLEAVAEIRATGRSADGWVTVTREPSGQIDVQIRPGLIRTHTADQVAEEIRTALLAALADHRRAFRQTRVEFFGVPLGVGEFTAPPAPAIGEPVPAEPEQPGWRRFQV